MAPSDPRQTKFVLDESRIPRAWYNIAADLPVAQYPPLHPATHEPIGPADPAPPPPARPAPAPPPGAAGADRPGRPRATLPDGTDPPGGVGRARDRDPG